MTDTALIPIPKKIEELSRVGLEKLEHELSLGGMEIKDLKEVTFGLLDRVGHSPKSGQGELPKSLAEGAITGALKVFSQFIGVDVPEPEVRDVTGVSPETAGGSEVMVLSEALLADSDLSFGLMDLPENFDGSESSPLSNIMEQFK